MGPDAIAPLILFLGTGTFILIGMRMWLTARGKREREGLGDEVERLTEAIGRLHEETRILRDELAELHERVDFSERMLARGGVERSPPRRDATPA